MHHHLPAARVGLLAALLTAPTLAAQDFMPFGQPVGGGDDVLIGPLNLGFVFTFPDGTTTSQVEVDTNGRIFAAGTGSSSPTESGAGAVAGPTMILPYWDDLVVDDLHFAVDGTTAVITWPDARESGLAPAMTMQVQLTAPNLITVLWDQRVAGLTGDALVGVSGGAANPDPGPFQFADLADGPLFGGPTAYDPFAFILNDGASTSGIEFERHALGQYSMTGINIPDRARTLIGRDACPIPQRSFVIDTNGPAITFAEGGTPDLAYADGIVLDLGLDQVSPPLPMNFTFGFPNGVAASAVQVDSNGRLLEPGTGEGSDFTPSVIEFLFDPTAQICPLWCDWNTQSPDTEGNIWYHAAPTFTSVTWSKIAPFTGFRPQTFQAVLRSDGSIEFHYLDVEFVLQRNALIGVSAGGNPPNPGPVDFSSGSGTGSPAALYEEFLVTLDPDDTYDLDQTPSSQVAISLGAARLGSTVQALAFDDTGTALAVTFQIGLPSGLFAPAIDLGGVFPELAGCALLVEATVADPIFVPGSLTGLTSLFTVPDSPSLIGFDALSVSALFVNPTTPPFIQPTREHVPIFGL